MTTAYIIIAALFLIPTALALYVLSEFKKTEGYLLEQISSLAQNVAYDKAAIANIDEDLSGKYLMSMQRVEALETAYEQNGMAEFDKLFLEGMQNIANYGANGFEKLNVEGIKHG